MGAGAVAQLRFAMKRPVSKSVPARARVETACVAVVDQEMHMNVCVRLLVAYRLMQRKKKQFEREKRLEEVSVFGCVVQLALGLVFHAIARAFDGGASHLLLELGLSALCDATAHR